MSAYTTITPRFQVHIPASIRKQAGLTKHGKALVSVHKAKIIIEPLQSNFMSLGAKYKVTKPIRAEKVRDFIDYSH